MEEFELKKHTKFTKLQQKFSIWDFVHWMKEDTKTLSRFIKIGQTYTHQQQTQRTKTAAQQNKPETKRGNKLANK